MAIEVWIAFAVASTVLLAIPGPTVILAVSYVVGKGPKTGWATVPGIVLGDFTAMTISLAGAGALLMTSATLFSLLKILGAAYLVWLGLKLWRSTAQLTGMNTATSPKDMWGMFWNSYFVTALNPKSIVFFIAFVPQFVDISQPLFFQFAILELTFLSLAGLNIILWAVLVGKMRVLFARPTMLKRLNKVGGGFLIGAGLITAATRSATGP